MGPFLLLVFDSAFHIGSFTPNIFSKLLAFSNTIFAGLEYSACTYCRVLIYRKDVWLALFDRKREEIDRWELEFDRAARRRFFKKKKNRGKTYTPQDSEERRRLIIKLNAFMTAATLIINALPDNSWWTIPYIGMTTMRSFETRYVCLAIVRAISSVRLTFHLHEHIPQDERDCNMQTSL